MSQALWDHSRDSSSARFPVTKNILEMLFKQILVHLQSRLLISCYFNY